MGPCLIELRDVSRSFGSKTVLKEISLQVREGETLVVLGGSGSGKSVLLRTMVGLLPLQSGSLFYRGTDFSKAKEHQWNVMRREVSYLFQGGALFDSMTVFDNLAFPLKEHGKVTKKEVEAKVRLSLERVDLDAVAHLYPSDLSGGMMKRVALARAIITEPKVILYDEPTTGLDPLTTDTINQLILRMQRELNVTSVVVTHDMSTVHQVTDRLAFLQQGRIAFLGSLEEARTCVNETLCAYIRRGCCE
jgi:phospholipid/cholesterol/gamma-HCH transport system ATP-binding protein